VTKVGVVAPDDAAAVRRLEEAGVDSLWVGGHVASPNPSPEPLVWLARLVEQTTRVTVGTATLLLPLYAPAVVAKQVADLDRASGGRLALGVGVGGEHASDFAAAEVPRSERGSRTDEAVDLLRRFWTAEPVEHRGRHFAFDGVRIHPAPAQPGGPPILVSGRSEAAMRRAALRGDGWMPYLCSPRWYRESVERIRSMTDRDLQWFVYVLVAVDDDPAAARRGALEFFGTTWGQDADHLVDHVAAVGTPAQVAQRLADYDADHLVLCPVHGDPTPLLPALD
jgi:probable F420-dependent oxidoreductase